MGNVRLRLKSNPAVTIEKSEHNWKHLPTDRRALYDVIDGDTAAEAVHFSPPELKKPIEKEIVPASATVEKKDVDETQEQQIIRLFKEAAPDEAGKKEAIKSIAKIVGAHWKSVEKIVNDSLK